MERIEFDGTVTIDELTYVGRELEMRNGVFLVDGRVVRTTGATNPVHVTIQGNVRGNITGVCSVTIEHGSVYGNVSVTSGGRGTSLCIHPVLLPSDINPPSDDDDDDIDNDIEQQQQHHID